MLHKKVIGWPNLLTSLSVSQSPLYMAPVEWPHMLVTRIES